MVILRRLLGVLLALAGLVPLALGAWFATQLGPSGTARFEVPTAGATPVLLTPQILNRTDLPVQIDVTADRAEIAVAAPSDTAAVLGAAARREVTSVSVPDWSAQTKDSGSGTARGPGEIELWRVREEVAGAGGVRIEQSTAPESVLILPGKEGLSRLTLTWSHDTWFYQALVLSAAGALLVTVGWLLARPGRPVARPTREVSS